MATNFPPVEPVPTDAQSSGHPLFSCPYEKCRLPPDFRNRVQDHIKTTHALDKLYPCPEPGCYKAYLSPVDILQHRITRHPRNHICPRYLCQALCSQVHLEYHAHDDKVQKKLKRDASKNTAKHWTEYQPAATKPPSEEHLEVHSQEYQGGAVDGGWQWIEYQHDQKPATKPKVPKPKKASGRTEHQNPARGFAVDESESMRILDRDFFNHALGASPRPSHSRSRPQRSRSVVASVSDSMDALDRDFFNHALRASPRPSHSHSRPQTNAERKDSSIVSDSMDALDRGFFAHVLADPPNYAQPATSYSTMPSSSYASSSAQHQWSGYAPAPYQGASQPAYTTMYVGEMYDTPQYEPTRSSYHYSGAYYAP
ncbi:hypothetical protein BDZ89DRAFT_1160453 [Hymenopellis radicata]|nr:hypothetical protein BDZ89DRAFT_1160453 [Hymenopellis radicata]